VFDPGHQEARLTPLPKEPAGLKDDVFSEMCRAAADFGKL
jgi:hypothetical protein